MACNRCLCVVASRRSGRQNRTSTKLVASADICKAVTVTKSVRRLVEHQPARDQNESLADRVCMPDVEDLVIEYMKEPIEEQVEWLVLVPVWNSCSSRVRPL